MAKDISTSIKECEEELAKHVKERYAMLEGYFKEKKNKEFEDRAKKAAASFDGMLGSANVVRAIREMNDFETMFVKWYENDEDIDDAPFFAHSISLFKETKERLGVYQTAMNLLADAQRNTVKAKQACMAEFEKAKDAYKAAVEKFNSMAQGTDNEKTMDDASTLARYLDLNHEARLVEMMAPSGKGALEKTLAQLGSEHGQVMMLRSHAYHLKNKAMQRAAADAIAAFFTYEGVLCAAYVFADVGGK